jgi:cell division protein FtsB
MEVVSLGLILILVVGICIFAAVVGGIVLLVVCKPAISSSSSELACLRKEVARLQEEVERLREEVEQIKGQPKAAGLTDIRSK